MERSHPGMRDSGLRIVVQGLSHGDSEAEEGNTKAGFSRDVSEGAITIVVVELQSGRAVFGMAGPVLAVDQKDVGITIVVVIDEGATRAHGFGQPLFSERSVVVGEMDSGLGGDVAKGDLCWRGRCC